MESCVESKLQKLGYYVNTVPYGYINACNAWYKNELIEKFHRRTSIQGEEYVIERMNLQREDAQTMRICARLSRLMQGMRTRRMKSIRF